MIIDKFKKAIQEYRLIDKNDLVLIGVSGGPDSVALFRLLNSLKGKLQIKLHVAHLDHMLRKNSGLDCKFVESMANRFGVPVTCAKVNIKKLIKKGGSAEEAARNARLDFFFKTAKKIKADKIALGHNLDDQAETILMRLLRGTGLYGLGGISPKRKICGFIIIRPLIEIKRRQIEAFLKKGGIKYHLDQTNRQEIYFRNKIRNKLLPLLEKGYNQNTRGILAHLAESAGLDYEYLHHLANIAVQRLGRKINLREFNRLHPAIQRLVFRLNIAKLKGDLRCLTFRHIRELEDLILNRPVNSIVDLPKGISAVKKRRNFYFYRR